MFMPEQNLGLEAAHLETYIKDRRLVTMQEGQGSWYGVRKSGTTTLGMHTFMCSTLSSRSLAVTDDCIGIPTKADQKRLSLKPGSAEARTHMLRQLEKQFNAYRWEETNALRRKNFQEKIFKLTGKRGKDNDDLLICALMIPYWREVFWRSPKESYRTAMRLMGVLGPASAGMPVDPLPSASALVRNPNAPARASRQ